MFLLQKSMSVSKYVSISLQIKVSDICPMITTTLQHVFDVMFLTISESAVVCMTNPDYRCRMLLYQTHGDTTFLVFCCDP